MTAAGLILLMWAVLSRKRPLLITTDAILAILLAAVLVFFPLIFGAGIRDILLIWAPWSLTGGLSVITFDIIVITIKLFWGNNHEHNNKTGKRQPADGNNRIS